MTPCTRCRGTGRAEHRTCPVCRGLCVTPSPADVCVQVEGVGVREVARRLGWQRTLVSNLATGRAACSWERYEAICGAAREEEKG